MIFLFAAAAGKQGGEALYQSHHSEYAAAQRWFRVTTPDASFRDKQTLLRLR
jgi:hypothetical protein